MGGYNNRQPRSAVAPVNEALSYVNNDYGYGNYGGEQGNWDFNSAGNPMGNDGGLFSNLSGNDWMQGAMGAGQIGLGLMNYFENKKNSKAQRAGLQQQIDQSKYAVQTNKDFKAGTAAAFA